MTTCQVPNSFIPVMRVDETEFGSQLPSYGRKRIRVKQTWNLTTVIYANCLLIKWVWLTLTCIGGRKTDNDSWSQQTIWQMYCQAADAGHWLCWLWTLKCLVSSDWLEHDLSQYVRRSLFTRKARYLQLGLTVRRFRWLTRPSLVKQIHATCGLLSSMACPFWAIRLVFALEITDCLIFFQARSW